MLTEQTLSYAETFSATSPLYGDTQTSYERPEHNQWALKTRLVVMGRRSWRPSLASRIASLSTKAGHRPFAAAESYDGWLGQK